MVLWIIQEEKGMRTVIDATTPAVKDEVVKGAKKAVAKLAERGLKGRLRSQLTNFQERPEELSGVLR